MTMRATRDALRHGESFARACQTWPTTPWERQHYFDSLATFPAALVEVAAVEAVVEAARQIIHGGDSTRALGPFDMRTPTLFALRDALARLDAVTGGQT